MCNKPIFLQKRLNSSYQGRISLHKRKSKVRGIQTYKLNKAIADLKLVELQKLQKFFNKGK